VVCEVLALSVSDETTAMADAVAILERLLRERGLSPPRYLELARAHADRVGPVIGVVRSRVGRVSAVERGA